MPRKKVNHSEERRMSLGDFERKLEQDKLAMRGVEAASVAISGIAQGLGLGGGLIVAAILWGKDLEKLFEQIIGIWPESGSFFSPEWIANWGDNPTEITVVDITTPDNPRVNELDPLVDGTSLVGRSSSNVYSLACSGRAAEYDHSRNNILDNWLLRQPPTNNLNSPLVGDYSAGLTDEQKALIIAEWHQNNPPPPIMLTVDQQAEQTNIRITAAHNKVVGGWLFNYFSRSLDDPTTTNGFIEDVLLDWLAYSSPNAVANVYGYSLGTNLLDAASPTPYDYRSRRSEGEYQIHMFAFWSAPP